MASFIKSQSNVDLKNFLSYGENTSPETRKLIAILEEKKHFFWRPVANVIKKFTAIIY
jgi:hypothetical protein